MAAISSYNNSVKEAVSSARESGNAWEENNTSIEDNISRIQELRTELASGTLTEQEAADAKSELLSIQESLTDSYGDQVQGIDLINGSLQQQIELLDKVSQKESENFLNENKKGIDKATKEMEKNRHNYLGQFYDNGSDESEALKTSIQKLQKTYGDEVVKLEKGSDGITMNVAIDADATTAKDALNDFMTEVSDIEKQYGESDTLELLSDNAAAGLTDTKDVLEEYQSLYEQVQKAEMKSDKTLFSADGKDQTATKWLSDYAKAVKEYNDAVSDGDDTKIKDAASSFNELDSTMQGLAKGSMSEYADQVQEVRDQLNETAIANDKFTKAVKGSDSSDFGKTVTDSVKALKELNLTDTDFKYAFETDGIQEGEDAVNSLVDAAVQCGVISDTSSEQVGNLVNMLVQLGVISSSTGAGLDTAADSASGLATQIENVNTALSGIEKANSLLNSQSTGQSISIDDFNSDELADYTSALEYNNGALQLNAEKVRELQKAKAEEAIQTNDNQKLEKQNQYMENIAQIEQLQEELRGLADAKSDNAQSIQDNIDALLSENDSIVNQCNQLDLLSASLREATGAYQNWLDKQNASESGDMFDDAMGALQHIEDTTQNTDSEYYGRTGREDYKAAVDFIVPDTIDHDDEAAVSSYIDSMAVMGLHGQNYNTYMAQANQYAEEIKKLNAEIAKDPNNTKLIDRRKELLEAQRDNIKSAEDEKQAMADLIEDGINRQIDALGTLIDEYEDSIDSAKDLYDYQKKVKDQTEEISKIQKQLNAYSGDDSEESKANIQKLKEDLKDAQEDLQDTQYDRYISEQKKLLSDLSDNYKETLNARLDNIDALVADMITKSNENKESINQTLQTESDKVGYTISDAMKDIWGATNNVLGTTDNKGSILGQVTSVNEVLNAINAKVQSMQTNSDKQSTQVNEGAKTDTALPAKNENTGSNNSNNSNNSNQPVKKNTGSKQGNGKVEVGDHVTFVSGSYTGNSSGGGGAGNQNRGKKVYVTKIQKGAKKPYHISTGKKLGSGDLGWVTKSQLKGYKTGGLVDYTGLAQLDGTPSKPELVLNSVDTENFLKLRDALRDGFNFTPNMNTPMFANTAFDGIASQIKNLQAAAVKQNVQVTTNYEFNIPIDHVENYEDFMNQLKKDDKFEKMIQSMTTDRLAGGSKLAKNKFNW